MRIRSHFWHITVENQLIPRDLHIFPRGLLLFLLTVCVAKAQYFGEGIGSIIITLMHKRNFTMLSSVVHASVVTALSCAACINCNCFLLWCMQKMSPLSPVVHASIVTALFCDACINCHCSLPCHLSIPCHACINCHLFLLWYIHELPLLSPFLWCMHQLSLLSPFLWWQCQWSLLFLVVSASVVTDLPCGTCVNCHSSLLWCMHCLCSLLWWIHKLLLLFNFLRCQHQLSFLFPDVHTSIVTAFSFRVVPVSIFTALSCGAWSTVTAFFCGACMSCHSSLLWCMHQFSLIYSFLWCQHKCHCSLLCYMCQLSLLSLVVHALSPVLSCGVCINCHYFFLSCHVSINCHCPLLCYIC